MFNGLRGFQPIPARKHKKVQPERQLLKNKQGEKVVFP